MIIIALPFLAITLGCIAVILSGAGFMALVRTRIGRVLIFLLVAYAVAVGGGAAHLTRLGYDEDWAQEIAKDPVRVVSLSRHKTKVEDYYEHKYGQYPDLSFEEPEYFVRKPEWIQTKPPRTDLTLRIKNIDIEESVAGNYLIKEITLNDQKKRPIRRFYKVDESTLEWHIRDYRAVYRIEINGADIKNQKFNQAFWVKATSEKVTLTYDPMNPEVFVSDSIRIDKVPSDQRSRRSAHR